MDAASGGEATEAIKPKEEVRKGAGRKKCLNRDLQDLGITGIGDGEVRL